MSCKRKTGIAFVIEERDDGTFRAMMGSNKDMPQDACRSCWLWPSWMA